MFGAIDGLPFRSSLTTPETPTTKSTIVLVEETPGRYAQRPRDDEGADIDYVLIGPYDPPRAVGAATMEEPAVEELVQKVVTASREPGTARQAM